MSFLKKNLQQDLKMRKVGLLTGNITYRAKRSSPRAPRAAGRGLYSTFIQQRVMKLKKNKKETQTRYIK